MTGIQLESSDSNQSIAFSHTIWIVQAEDPHRYSSDRGARADLSTLPRKMLFPKLFSRIEERHQGARNRIERSDVRTLVPIAAETR
jgi:hypothetical protein